MRRVFGAFIAAVILVGLAAVTNSSAAAPALGEEGAGGSTVAVQRVSVSSPIRDEAAMVLVGTALIGLAAAVRRAA